MHKAHLASFCLLLTIAWHNTSHGLSLVMSPYIEHLKHDNRRDCEAAGGSFIKWYDEIYCRKENPILRQTISQTEFATLSSEQIDHKLSTLGLPPIGGIGHYSGHPFYKLTRSEINSLSPQQIAKLYQLTAEQINTMSASEMLHWVAPILTNPP